MIFAGGTSRVGYEATSGKYECPASGKGGIAAYGSHIFSKVAATSYASLFVSSEAFYRFIYEYISFDS